MAQSKFQKNPQNMIAQSLENKKKQNKKQTNKKNNNNKKNKLTNKQKKWKTSLKSTNS